MDAIHSIVFIKFARVKIREIIIFLNSPYQNSYNINLQNIEFDLLISDIISVIFDSQICITKT
jgi:hypothetical protein